ncbi:hypothetical protein R6Q59_035338 [Mikania micrantha]
MKLENTTCFVQLFLLCGSNHPSFFHILLQILSLFTTNSSTQDEIDSSPLNLDLCLKDRPAVTQINVAISSFPDNWGFYLILPGSLTLKEPLCDVNLLVKEKK